MFSYPIDGVTVKECLSKLKNISETLLRDFLHRSAPIIVIPLCNDISLSKYCSIRPNGYIKTGF